MIDKNNFFTLTISLGICSAVLVEFNYRLMGFKNPNDDRTKYAKLELHDNEHHFCKGPKIRNKKDLMREYTEFPNHEYIEYRNGEAKLHTYNQYGYRINERDSKKSKDIKNLKKTIWVFGDSFVRGSLADNTETIPSFLSRLSNDDINFINFGVGGNGYLNATKHLDWAIKNLPTKPYAIVFIGHSNDIKDDIRAEKNLFEEAVYIKQINNTSELNKKTNFFGARINSLELAFNHYLIPRFQKLISKRKIQSNNLPPDAFKKSYYYLNDFTKSAKSLTPLVFTYFIPHLYENDVFTLEGFDSLNISLMEKNSKKNEINFLVLNYEVMKSKLFLKNINISSKKDLYGNPDHHLNELGYYLASLSIAEDISLASNFSFKKKLKNFNLTDLLKKEVCP